MADEWVGNWELNPINHDRWARARCGRLPSDGKPLNLG